MNDRWRDFGTRRSAVAGISIVIWTVGVGVARGDDLPPIAAGFRPHVVNQKGGGIDWTSGEIIVEGVGKLRGNRPADRLGAQRAASLVAARNALAVANGIQIDAHGRVGNVRSGRITLDGVVKGQRVDETTWDKTKNPVECHVKLRVPLWGLSGICTVFSEGQRRAALQQGGRRLPLANVPADVTESVLIIDARGRKTDLCLFPVVRSEDGAVLYDVATRTDPQARSEPPVRYVETDMTFETLRASLERPARRTANVPVVPQLGSIRGMHALSANEWVFSMLNWEGPASSQPTTSPASQPTSRPGRRRVVVKAAHPVAGQAPSQIVLTKEDAEKIRQSPEGASLLRSGKVIVVVDSAAAGIQGRLPRDADEPSLASSAR
ncbi:MAG TPA: hypothetical protein VJZ71_09260 [Phycisphaerae bacterium]|nr:hypothetical protein [Phycisphaerae bacterium]